MVYALILTCSSITTYRKKNFDTKYLNKFEFIEGYSKESIVDFHDINENKFCEGFDFSLQKNHLVAMAISYGHLKCWNRCLELNIPCLILEDDVELVYNWKNNVNNFFKISDNSTLTLLTLWNSGIRSKCNKYSDALFDKLKTSYGNSGALGYILTPNVAKFLIDNFKFIQSPIDHYILGIGLEEKNYNVFCTKKDFVKHKNMLSLRKNELKSTSKKLENLPHILWINLEKDKNRKQHMETLFHKFNLSNTRIEGIHGSQYLNYCFPKKNLTSDEEKATYGCFLSHIKALDHFVKTPALGDYCLIAEDDLSFEYLPYWQKTFWDYIPENFTVIQLSVIYGQKQLNNNVISNKITINLRKHEYYMWGTACYLIKRKTAERLLKLVPKINNKYKLNKVKNVISDCFVYQQIKNVYSIPLFTFNASMGSNIHEEHIDRIHVPSKRFITNLWKNK